MSARPHRTRRSPWIITIIVVAVFASGDHPAGAFSVDLTVAGSDKDLGKALRAASNALALEDDATANAPAVVSAAVADYRSLVETLYAHGYYSGVVDIRVDGRPAADIALRTLPSEVGSIAIKVDPGPAFRFGTIRVAPTPPGQTADPALASGERARSTAIRDAVKDTVDGWRDAGHAKAEPVSQEVVADHRAATLDATVGVDPGPRVTFGDMVITTPSAVRDARLRQIAGFPSGTVFSPESLKTVATRLRRTGAFSSVTLSEADILGPDDTLDVGLTVADQKPRRFGFGAELASFEGLGLSGYWLHRNLLGGAERLRFDAEISQIGGQSTGFSSAGGTGPTDGTDYSVASRFEIPALFGADTSGFAFAQVERLDEPDFASDQVSFGVGASRIFSDEITGEGGLAFRLSETDDDIGSRTFTLMALPTWIEWDRRDAELNPTEGSYLRADATPFIGLDGTASGMQSKLDARVYRGFGQDRGVVLAGRLQFGSVLGSSLRETHPDFLFFSGGGGTVRGQPYQSLNVDLGGGAETGGRSFLGLSGEVRVNITDTIGAVAFADAGYIGGESFYDDSGNWHTGAGVGLRYNTGLGPVRLDVATPVGGSTGDGVQLYLGIGQAF